MKNVFHSRQYNNVASRDMRIDGKKTSENSQPQLVILIRGQGFNQIQTFINAMEIIGLGNYSFTPEKPVKIVSQTKWVNKPTRKEKKGRKRTTILSNIKDSIGSM